MPSKFWFNLVAFTGGSWLGLACLLLPIAAIGAKGAFVATAVVMMFLACFALVFSVLWAVAKYRETYGPILFGKNIEEKDCENI